MTGNRVLGARGEEYFAGEWEGLNLFQSSYAEEEEGGIESFCIFLVSLEEAEEVVSQRID